MIEKYKTSCTGCRACEKVCPFGVIRMMKDEKGFLYPEVDEGRCIHCGICENRCPLNNKEGEGKKIAYAAYSKDTETRLNSSSGGVFSVLAEYVIEHGGIVYGAAFNNDFKLQHIGITQKEELYKLRTSKYLQSNVQNTYVEAKKYLENGTLVYYSGTPCQIEGFKNYLAKDYTNLITQDIICHGVPAPKVWEEYLKYKNQKFEEINFRSKEQSTWGDYELKFKYDGKVEFINHEQDQYMKLFLNNYILRESCYHCQFKKINRVSDFLLADFWGINNICPEMNDQKGTSLVVINTEKAEKIWEEVSESIVKKQVDFYEAIQFNKSMNNSSTKPADFEQISEKIRDNKFREIFEGE